MPLVRDQRLCTVHLAKCVILISFFTYNRVCGCTV
uniref:Uncharacterized protein n=1 Tax=Anguilla anguilla TaxID=7936 RepID=A0A0E9WCP1_ANGAN